MKNPSVPTILLFDFDQTLYPCTLTTQGEVDKRISLYIQNFLGLSPEGANALRREMWDEFGTTLRGLQLRHGVDPDHYCDFVHAIEDHHLPPPDPAMREWLARLASPAYIFTNARMDWTHRSWRSMDMGSLPPGFPYGSGRPDDKHRDRSETTGNSLPLPSPILGILDIAFTGWLGKPHKQSYAMVEELLKQIHGPDIRIVFADDHPVNLVSAQERNWSTVWIRPEGALAEAWRGRFDWESASLLDLDPGRW